MNDRVAMWKAGGAMIAERPLFGVGPGRVKALYPVYRVPRLGGAAARATSTTTSS